MRFTQDRFGPMFAAAIRKPRLTPDPVNVMQGT
jgi:hypothetical protein